MYKVFPKGQLSKRKSYVKTVSVIETCCRVYIVLFSISGWRMNELLNSTAFLLNQIPATKEAFSHVGCLHNPTYLHADMQLPKHRHLHLTGLNCEAPELGFACGVCCSGMDMEASFISF